MADSESSFTSKLARLASFPRAKRVKDDEDQGEAVDYTSVAGGGHSARKKDVDKSQFKASRALKSMLVNKQILSSEEAKVYSDDHSPALQALLDQPHIKVPAELTDRSHTLPEYFISSSHNTYLMTHQLFGESSAAAYETALNAGARCVEIDAWDHDEDKEEPKVTHGYTLVSNIPFRSVCETIRDVVDKEAQESANQDGYRAAPIFLSLENHCDAHGQLRLVQIMEEVWGDRLLSKSIREKGHDEQEGGHHVTLDELKSKICVIVEYHFPDEAEDSDTDDSSGEEEEEKEARKSYKEKKKETASTVIIPELAAIGVYAQSVKPVNNSWFEELDLKDGPHHHLINVSESGLGSHMPAHNDRISLHNAKHLMRVFPKGTRISSNNLSPVPYWGVGAQICALNWQTFGASMQLNEALFSGTDGYVLKPTGLRRGGNGKLNTVIKKTLRLQVACASNVPVPDGRDAADIKPYLTCSLIHADDLENIPPKRKTNHYRPHTLEILHKGTNPPPTDPLWDETLEWEYEDNELVFLKMLIKSDDRFASNPKLAAASIRLLYAVPGWIFIPFLDLKGRKTECILLAKVEIEDAY